jgi:microcystin-dependent protein
MAWPAARYKTFIGGGAFIPADANAIQDMFLRASGIELGDLAASVPLPPIGTIMPYVGDAAPDANWLLCDGSAVNRVTYATLFARAGTAYGAGDGSTTFNLPDLRGRIPVGVDGAAGRLSANDAKGNTGGTPASNMPSHSHGGGTGFTSNGHTHQLIFSAFQTGGGGAFHNLWVNGAGTLSSTGGQEQDHWHAISAEGSGGAMDNLPPYQVVNYIIRAL